jgi:prepilin-type processing-associated H-X9-DG protein
VIGPNVAAKMKQITDGTSNTLLLGEVRAGIVAADRRGTWALGAAGASALFWFGQTGDDNGPNLCSPLSDDTKGLKSPEHDSLMIQECMYDYTGDDLQVQATVRSAHAGGVNIVLCDGSARFIGNTVDIGPCNQAVKSASSAVPWPPECIMSTWDRFIASGDDLALGELPQ